MLHKLGIRNTLQNNIWQAITHDENTLWVCIGYKNANLEYYGIIRYYDEREKHPPVVLYGYSKVHTIKTSKVLILPVSKGTLVI